MNNVFTQFARVSIILLMLISQSAMIEHAIGHSDVEHAESCSVCISADNVAAVVESATPLSAVCFTLSWARLESQSFIQTKLTYHLSRAPPHLFTV